MGFVMAFLVVWVGKRVQVHPVSHSYSLPDPIGVLLK